MAIVFDDEQVKKSKIVFDDEKTKMGGRLPTGEMAKFAFGMLPQVQAAKWAFKNPQVSLPIAGTAIGTMILPGAGSALGAGLGQIGGRMSEIAKGSPVQSPVREAVGPMVQAGLGGLFDVSGVATPGTSTLAEKIGNSLAKRGGWATGTNPNILKQAFKQGWKTYLAPSIEKAQEVFGNVLGPEGKAALKEGVSETFDPAVSQARSTAVEIGTKMEKGQPVTAIEALKARQATDRVISATSITDKRKLDKLYEWRKAFDDVMTSQRGDLKQASNLYRQAVVKDTLLNPSRLTKSGRPSAFLPMILGAGSRGAAGVGMGLGATSPLAWGLGATTAGEISPTAAKAMQAAILQKILKGNNPNESE